MRGVNLGNWLVLEKWMSPELFDGLKAEDETYFCRELGPERCRERLKVHRDTYITSRDFCDMAAKGFGLVRIPVPFFLFEDVGPYVHCYEYLDRAFDWAEQYGMKILVDLHTVPGGQNGTDNAGLCGICQWSTKQEYVDFTEDVLEKIAIRYGKREGMWGIEVLNEPMCSDTPAGQYMNIQTLIQVYPPVDKEAAKANENYSLAFLQDFYRRAYRRIRKHMTPDKSVVFHDAFCMDLWEDFFHEEGFENIILDTHQYLMMEEPRFTEKTMETYQEHFKRLGEQISSVAKTVPLIVGEWCLSNAMVDPQNTSKEEALEIYRQMSDGYMSAMKDSMPWLDQTDAVLAMYTAGQGMSEAAWKLLYGEKNPCGKLAETWPLRLGHTPCSLNYPQKETAVYEEGIYIGYRYYDKKMLDTLFDFGYGLSYTTWDYSNLRVSSGTFDADKPDSVLNVQVDVTNTGTRAGSEIVELYVKKTDPQVSRPVKELKGFRKICCEPGETKTVSFTLDKRSFAYYSTKIHDWYAESGEYVIMAGAAVRDIRAETAVNVESGPLPVHYNRYSTAEEIMETERGRQIMMEMMSSVAPADAGQAGTAQSEAAEKAPDPADDEDNIADAPMDAEAMGTSIALVKLPDMTGGMFPLEAVDELIRRLNGTNHEGERI